MRKLISLLNPAHLSGSLVGRGIAITLCFLGMAYGAATSPAIQGRAATIEFIDGSTLGLHDARFVYVWYHRSMINIYNRARYEYKTQDFSYSDVVKNVDITRTVLGKKIKGLTFTYATQGNDLLLLEKALIDLIDGGTVDVPVDFGDHYEGVNLSESLRVGDDPGILEYFCIEGQSMIEGKEGKFRALLLIMVRHSG